MYQQGHACTCTTHTHTLHNQEGLSQECKDNLRSAHPPYNASHQRTKELHTKKRTAHKLQFMKGKPKWLTSTDTSNRGMQIKCERSLLHLLD